MIVKQILNTLKWDGLIASEYAKLETLVELLKPFAVQTDLLQADNNTLSCVLPAVIDLIFYLEGVCNAKTMWDFFKEVCNEEVCSLCSIIMYEVRQGS
jgi:hypothetical protein